MAHTWQMNFCPVLTLERWTNHFPGTNKSSRSASTRSTQTLATCILLHTTVMHHGSPCGTTHSVAWRTSKHNIMELLSVSRALHSLGYRRTLPNSNAVKVLLSHKSFRRQHPRRAQKNRPCPCLISPSRVCCFN